MDPEETNPTPDALDREIAEFLRDADRARARPDQRPLRGNQAVEPDDLERGREKLDRVL